MAKRRMDAAFEFFRKIRGAVLVLPRPRHRPRGRDARRVQPQPRPAGGARQGAAEGRRACRLLWGTANLFSNPRYMCGAATNPDAHVFAYAAAQVKKALEVTHELGGENYVFWGGREGYETLLNTDLKREQEHLAAFLHMAVDYAKPIGFKGQFLIEPKPKEPTKHQYDFDVASGIAFLRTHGLDEALQVQHRDKPRHSGRAHLPARDRGGGLAGTARFDRRKFRRPASRLGHGPVQHRRQGAHARDGRRSCGPGASARADSISTPSCAGPRSIPRTCFFAHIGGMDAYALAFKIARRILADGKFAEFRRRTLRELRLRFRPGHREGQTSASRSSRSSCSPSSGEPVPASGRQEYLENLLNRYLTGG